MPDITFKFLGDDELTPAINKIKGEINGLTKELSGATAAAQKATSAHTDQAKSLAHVGQEAKEASFFGEQFKEFAAGIGYQVGLWNVAFNLASQAIEAFTAAFVEVGSEYRGFHELQNRLVLSNKEAEETFGTLKMAATAAGRSVADASKDFMTLRSVGIGTTESIEMTKNFGRRLLETGVNITEIVAKTQLWKASFQDLVQLATSGAPFGQLYQPAVEGLKREAWQPYKELRLSVEHEIDEQTLQDRVRMIDREMEATTRAINQEMEDRHRAINREIEDRHRAAERAEQDTEHGISNEEYGINRIKGARSLELRGRELFGQHETKWERTERQYDELAEDKRLFELEGQQHELRERQRIAERQREDESRITGRKFQDETIQTERRLALWRLETMYTIQDAQLKMERVYTNERIKDELDLVETRLTLELKANQLVEQDRRARAIKEAQSFGLPAPGGGQGTGTPYNLPPEQQMRIMTPEETKSYQQNSDMIDWLSKAVRHLEDISRAFE